MNQLEALQKLYIKKKTISIGKENIQLEIEPLSLDDLALFGKVTGKDTSAEESAKVMIKVLAKSLNVPEEEISKISMEYMNELMEHFMEINNMSDVEKKQTNKIADFIKQKQDIKNIDTSNISQVN